MKKKQMIVLTVITMAFFVVNAFAYVDRDSKFLKAGIPASELDIKLAIFSERLNLHIWGFLNDTKILKESESYYQLILSLRELNGHLEFEHDSQDDKIKCTMILRKKYDTSLQQKIKQAMLNCFEFLKLYVDPSIQKSDFYSEVWMPVVDGDLNKKVAKMVNGEVFFLFNEVIDKK